VPCCCCRSPHWRIAACVKPARKPLRRVLSAFRLTWRCYSGEPFRRASGLVDLFENRRIARQVLCRNLVRIDDAAVLIKGTNPIAENDAKMRNELAMPNGPLSGLIRIVM
jgi:hypothetical protein